MTKSLIPARCKRVDGGNGCLFDARRRLAAAKFERDAVDIAKLPPDDVRRFHAEQLDAYRTTTNASRLPTEQTRQLLVGGRASRMESIG